jgi:hypothetical protein
MKQYLADHPEVAVFDPETVQIMGDALDASTRLARMLMPYGRHLRSASLT